MSPQALRRIGIVGAGPMGSGIAEVCARQGYSVTLCDLSEARLHEGLARIRRSTTRPVSRACGPPSTATVIVDHITPAGSLSALASADIVIEAVTEDEAVKSAIFRELAQVLRPDVLLATNTSTLSVSRLAEATDRAPAFIGMHFMNPAPAMQLVEVIRGIRTSAETLAEALALVRSLGKTPVESEDFPAFILNRVLVGMINEAVYILYEGIASVASIDTAMRCGANHRMGPLELADFIGLDTVLAAMTALNKGFSDAKYRPCPLLVKYVEAGWLGRKSGRGFYDYRFEPPIPTR